MLKLRPEQVAAFASAGRERYVRQVLPTFAAVFPDDPRVLDERAMRALVESGIERAAAYGIRDDREVTLFLYLLHELGEAFDRLPWVASLLNAPDLAPREKLDALYRRLELRS
ncbi:MAG TPA: hypothetical protein VEU30_06645 [Thermoanaerobaculia bacterium]|nr:hypothetical protein [Thermoanaerobaculia bacterium]